MPTDTSRILIIDDELPICQNCVKILSKMDYEVEYSLSGHDALRTIEETRFDVIITDIHMEKSWDGLQLLEQVKADHGGLAVIVLSGQQDDAVVSAALEKGADAFLSKPFKAEDLILSVTRAAGRAVRRH